MIGGLNKSLSRSLYFRMLIILFLVVLGAVILIVYNQKSKSASHEEILGLETRKSTISAVNSHWRQMLYRARGYYAYQEQADYDALVEEKRQLDQAMADYRSLPLDDTERQLIDELQQFVVDYFAAYLPEAVQAVHSGDYERLHALASGGVPSKGDQLLDETETALRSIDSRLAAQYVSLLDASTRRDLLFVGYVFLLTIVYGTMAWYASRRIGRPIGELAKVARLVGSGEYVEVPPSPRRDEIGQITNSFREMIRDIQQKEDVLTAQNEELIAQQDELQAQQEDLQEALRTAEDIRRQLERRNLLIQAMSITLDKDELLGSIIRGMVEVLRADKGLFVLLNEERDHASFGLSDRVVRRCLDSLDDGPLQRVREELRSYIVTRPADDAESGIHEAAAFVQDLYLPVLSSDQASVTAILILTVTGRPVSEAWEQEAAALSTQITLALDKLRLYDETETQRRMTQEVMDTIHEGVQLVDPNGMIRNFNNTMCELFQVERTGANGDVPIERFYRFVEDKITHSRQLIGFMEDRIRAGTSGQGLQFLYEIHTPTHRMVQVYAEQITRGDRRLGTVFVHRDITREYEVDQMKSEFVSTVSHELRTPLSSVLGFTELLLTRELKPERQKKYLTTIHQEAQRLTSLINDFLDIQRMESGRQTYDRSRIDLFEIVQEATELLAGPAGQTPIRGEVVGDRPVILGDRDKMMQVFMNLLSNAIKYSPDRGEITVICHHDEQGVSVSIRDQGLGIPKESLPKLFTKFYRVDNSDRREIGGTGLGLAIVREIVKAHGGEVDVESEFGIGSTFTVTFPPYHSIGSVQAAAGEETEPMGESARLVLVIEDDESLSELLCNELRSQGFRVSSYSDGQAALDAIRAHKPDAIVLDIMLRQSIDGWTILRELKNDESLRNIPVLVSTALDEREASRDLGATVYLVKPYAPRLLTQALQDAFHEG